MRLSQPAAIGASLPLGILLGSVGLSPAVAAPSPVHAAPKRAPGAAGKGAARAAGAPRAAGKGGGKSAEGAVSLAQQTMDAIEAGHFDEIGKKLDAAYRKSPQADTLYLMGRIAAAAGRTLDGYDLMRRYLADPGRSQDAGAVAEATRFLSTTPPPGGEVRVVGDAGALVLIDDRAVGTLPLPTPLLLPLGAHNLELVYPDKKLDSPVLAQQGRIAEVRSNRSSGAMLISVLPSLLVVLDAPEWSSEQTHQFWAAADRAAGDEQVTVLRPEVALAAAPDLKGCMARIDCWRLLAAKNQTQFVLGARHRAAVSVATAMAGAAAPVASGALAPAPTGATGSAGAAGAAGSVEAVPVIPGPTASVGTPAGPSGGAAVHAGPTGSGVAVGPAVGTPLELTLLHEQIEDPAAAPVTIDMAAPDALDKPLQQALSQLLSVGLNRASARVTIASDPRGAEVRIADRVIGTTPIERTMWAGRYVTEARRSGYRSEQRTIEIQGGQAERIEFDLAPLSFDVPQQRVIWERQPRPRWRFFAGGAGLLAGAALVGLGASALAVHGTCQPSDVIATTGMCRMPYQTLAPGIGLTVSGGVLLIAGGALLAWPGPLKKTVIDPDSSTAGAPRPASAGAGQAPLSH